MVKVFATLVGSALVSAVLAQANSEEATNVPEDKRTKAGHYLTAAEAAEMLQDPLVVFVDVRTRSEVAFLGMPDRVNVNIPYLVMPERARYDPLRRTYQMEPNPNFEIAFLDYAEEESVEDETPIVIMCRSGTRSAKAADMLFDLGYVNVYTVVDGFEGDLATRGPERGHPVVNGWKNAGLHWSYGISPEQVYPEDRN